MAVRERDVEEKLGRLVRGCGGLYLKFTSPGNRGVPDRIAVSKDGAVWFVELKAPGEDLRRDQRVWRLKLLKQNCKYAVVDGDAAIERFMRLFKGGDAE